MRESIDNSDNAYFGHSKVGQPSNSIDAFFKELEEENRVREPPVLKQALDEEKTRKLRPKKPKARKLEPRRSARANKKVISEKYEAPYFPQISQSEIKNILDPRFFASSYVTALENKLVRNRNMRESSKKLEDRLEFTTKALDEISKVSFILETLQDFSECHSGYGKFLREIERALEQVAQYTIRERATYTALASQINRAA